MRKPVFFPGLSRKFLLCAMLLFAGLALSPSGLAVANYQTMKVGLYYSSSRLTSANLANQNGSGFALGYYESGTTFVKLGETSQTSITMVRSSNVYRSGNDFSTSGTSNLLGCYHLIHSKGYASVQAAQTVASQLGGGFVAWIEGDIQVRLGNYRTSSEASAAAGSYTVGETSSYGINVVTMGTNNLIFQFDGGSTKSLGISPDISGHSDPTTWFKNIVYRGAFRYQRVEKGDITVVNVVNLESYIKGVIPYEMSSSWPVEALKTQAVCARTFGVNQATAVKHKSENFDLCNSACCQVYYGLGGPNTNAPSSVSDQAVTETAGMYLWYNSTLAGTFYSSSHGGASEAVSNVWSSDSQGLYPYLSGVVDPYEHMADSINSRSDWTYTFSKSELTTLFQGKGYGSDTTLSHLVANYSPTGNVMSLVVHWNNGKTNTVSGSTLRGSSWLSLPSIRFAINESLPTNKVYPGDVVPESSGGGYAVNEDQNLSSLTGAYVLTESGTQSISGSPFVITGTGTVEVLEPSEGSSSGTTTSTPSTSYNLLQGSRTATGDSFSFNGSGWGHSVGMSQYGAYAMAKSFGFDYQYILEFYFPGTYVAKA